MPPDGIFEYDFSLPLSKYNTLRYEDKTRERWKNEGVGEFVRNDRFACPIKPDKVEITIRKTYIIPLDWGGFFLCILTNFIFVVLYKLFAWFLCILPIDKNVRLWYNRRAAGDQLGPNFPPDPITQNFETHSAITPHTAFFPKP